MADSPALVATYRLQLTPTFGLTAAAAVAPYLARLGISHVYTSSYLQAAAGSTHGYDTTDHSRVSDELGGEPALAEFHRALKANGLGNVVDVVPNHMSVASASANQRWWNVLRDGPSPDASFFDIDWNPAETKLAGKVLLPVLGRDYAAEIADGSITVVRVDSEFEVHYTDLRFPVAPNTVVDALFDTPGAVHEILEQQHYRLACWRVARDELNYRRFFDVTTLAGVRVEEDDVFEAVHQRTLQWVRDGHVQGLRIDHPDGLRDPTGYLRQLRQAAPDAWIVVEKILEPGERLPASWPVDGTTGYDAMRAITALFVDPAGEATLTELFDSAVDDARSYQERLTESKRLVLDDLFGAELERLTRLAAGLAEASIVARDFSRREMRRALAALLIAMPVYRTYVATEGNRDARPDISAEDHQVITSTVEAARCLEPRIDSGLFDFLESAWRGNLSGCGTDTDASLDDFIARLQQLSGPVMAKGIEDTLFYRYNRLVALNEVGSDPSEFGLTGDEFHDQMVAAAASMPLSMTATSTHDTKRSEDVRAAIALLSEIADEWRAAVGRWTQMNASKWGAATPDRTMEHLLYQTFFAAWPLSAQRARQYMEKAVREAKLTSSWLHPSDAEGPLFAFAEGLATDPAFQADLGAFVDQLRSAMRVASLSQLVLKATVPGVPDFYQGSELWTSSLVDPDNRTDVDFAERVRLLDDLDAAGGFADTDALDATAHDGPLKLWMTRRLLQIRRADLDAFVGLHATYTPLELRGDRAADAIAFMRGARVVVVAAIRPVAVDRTGWGDTTIALPAGLWFDALSGPLAGNLAGNLAGAYRDVVAVAGITHHGCAVLIRTSVDG